MFGICTVALIISVFITFLTFYRTMCNFCHLVVLHDCDITGNETNRHEKPTGMSKVFLLNFL